MIHAPIDGRPTICAPVFIIVIVGSWFGMSAHIDWMTQMSSTTVLRCGHSSLSSRPLLPCLLNLNGDIIRLPVLRWVQDLAAGQRLAVVFLEHRLVVERVDVRHAAVHQQEDDPLRAGLEVAAPSGWRRSPPVWTGWSALGRRLQRATHSAVCDSATRPKPPPRRDSALTARDRFKRCDCMTCICSVS